VVFGFVSERLSDDHNRNIPPKASVRRKYTMAERARNNWRELCKAALNAKDPDELLEIVQELNKVLKREEQVRRDFREARELTSLPAQSEVKN
jgi:hypothetical protein